MRTFVALLTTLLLASPVAGQTFPIGERIKFEGALSCKDVKSTMDFLEVMRDPAVKQTQFKQVNEERGNHGCGYSDFRAIIDSQLPSQILVRPDGFYTVEIYAITIEQRQGLHYFFAIAVPKKS